MRTYSLKKGRGEKELGMNRTHESEEMYLETILLIKKRKGNVRSVDVAEELGYAKSSVSRGVNLLLEKGYINIGKGGDITFTESGLERAAMVYERHRVITRVLRSMGASKEVAEENACRIEHVISDELFEVLRAYDDSL